ncbi:unnamed protein product, partial [Vitis vinifera]
MESLREMGERGKREGKKIPIFTNSKQELGTGFAVYKSLSSMNISHGIAFNILTFMIKCLIIKRCSCI